MEFLEQAKQHFYLTTTFLQRMQGLLKHCFILFGHCEARCIYFLITHITVRFNVRLKCDIVDKQLWMYFRYISSRLRYYRATPPEGNCMITVDKKKEKYAAKTSLRVFSFVGGYCEAGTGVIPVLGAVYLNGSVWSIPTLATAKQENLWTQASGVKMQREEQTRVSFVPVFCPHYI